MYYPLTYVHSVIAKWKHVFCSHGVALHPSLKLVEVYAEGIVWEVSMGVAFPLFWDDNLIINSINSVFQWGNYKPILNQTGMKCHSRNSVSMSVYISFTAIAPKRIINNRGSVNMDKTNGPGAQLQTNVLHSGPSTLTCCLCSFERTPSLMSHRGP